MRIRKTCPFLLLFQRQKGQESDGDGPGCPHTEGQHESQGIEEEQDLVYAFFPVGFAGLDQSQGEQDGDSHTSGEHVGIFKNGGHADTGLHP